jgi:hypothetical protein
MKSLCTELAGLESIPHGRFGKPEFFADQEDRRDAQPALIFKQRIVHVPEHGRCVGELGAFETPGSGQDSAGCG